jgi:signal transduction histidine kinase
MTLDVRSASPEELAAEVERLAHVEHELAEYREEVEQQHAALIETQQALERSRDRYAELYDFAPIPYVLLDGFGVIHMVSLVGTRLLEKPRSQVVGLALLYLVVPEDRPLFLEHMRRCRVGGEVRTELRLTRPRGPVHVELYSTTARALGEEGILHPTLLRDLTHLHEAEHARQQAEEERRAAELREQAARAASASKDRFLAALSHELRTPLTPVLVAASALPDLESLPERVRDLLAVVRRNVTAQVRIVDDLLDLARIEHQKLRLVLEPVDVHALLADVLAGLAEQARAASIDLQLARGATNALVQGDRTRLGQVFANLLDNAMRFTPSGGSIRLATLDSGPDELRILVRDDGPGIDPALLERIFRPFEQGSAGAGGLGMGLPICRGIVERHGGRIHAESDPEQGGATFVVHLPAHTARLPSPSAPEAQDGARAGRRILLVEDHEETAHTLALLLRSSGHVVRVAASVADALAAADAPFDVLVSDIGLPDGTGCELLGELRRRKGDVRAIALSGYGFDHDVEQAHAAGFHRHLTKPVTLAQLLADIEVVAAG